MTPVERAQEIVIAWTNLFKTSEQNKADRNVYFWAFEVLSDYCRESPEEAWLVVQKLVASDDIEKIMPVVAAGPVEDLLVYHGESIIRRVEDMARQNATFRTLLGGVWKNSMTDEIWARVKAVSGPAW